MSTEENQPPERSDMPGLLPDDFGYENLTGNCGACGAYLIVNRATDLANASFAIGMSIQCSKCGTKLRISGDSGSHPIDHFLLWNYYSLHAEKRYMQCVLSIAQALEIALLTTAKFVLVQRPVSESVNPSEDEVRHLADLFERKIRNMTLEPLRNLVMKLAVHGVRPSSVAEASRWTSEVNNLSRDTPSAELLSNIADPKLREAVEKLGRVTVASVRNDVAHRVGRRPTASEVEAQHAQVDSAVREILTTFGLTPGGGQLVVGPPDDRA